MATATPTTVIVSISPSTTSIQSDIITPATPKNAGVMTAAQARKLEGLTPGGGGLAFQYAVQPGDGSDFIVPIPVDKRPSSASYTPSVVIQSGATRSTSTPWSTTARRPSGARSRAR